MENIIDADKNQRQIQYGAVEQLVGMEQAVDTGENLVGGLVQDGRVHHEALVRTDGLCDSMRPIKAH